MLFMILRYVGSCFSFSTSSGTLSTWTLRFEVQDSLYCVLTPLSHQFLCALPPELRAKWALRTVSLLKKSPDSVLICLEFPTHKPASSGGPPWSLPPTVHAELLKRPGDEITYDDKEVVVATERPEAENALVRVAHYTPQRTHGVGLVNGVVRDSVSIWRHKSVVS
jgi:hypothetical protein